MATEHGDRAVREAPLSLVANDFAVPAEPAEAEQYGLRVNWQSEEVKIEAAEFLLATRVQHDSRIRAAQDLEVLRKSAED